MADIITPASMLEARPNQAAAASFIRAPGVDQFLRNEEGGGHSSAGPSFITAPGVSQLMNDGQYSQISGPPSPIAKGLWYDVNVYQEGDLLHMDVYTCQNAKAEIFKASVDLRPIAKAVAAYHKLLHASTKVGKLVPGSDRDAVSANIRELMGAGYPQKQAIAIALHNAGLSRIGYTAAGGGLSKCPREYRVGEGPGRRNITDYRTLTSVMGDQIGELHTQADVLNDELLGVIVGCACQQRPQVGADLVVGWGWNPFKAAKKLVKDIGRTKLVKSVTKQIQAAATSPIISKAVTAATMVVPGGPLIAAQYNAVRLAANVHKANGNVLKAGVLQMQQAIRDNDPKSAVNAMVKALPKNLQHTAGPIVDKVYSTALSKVPGGNLAQLGQDALTRITSEALPTSVKDVARKAVTASKILADTAVKAGPAALAAQNLVPPSTAALLPKVSDNTLGIYAVAQRGIQAIEQANALRSAARAVSTIKETIPFATGTLISRAQNLKATAQNILAMPASTPDQIAAKRLMSERYNLQRAQIASQASQVIAMKREAAPKAAMLNAMDPTEIQQTLQLASQMQDALQKIMAAAQSPDLMVRESAQRAVAIFSLVARSNQAVQRMADSAHSSGVAVSGTHMVHRGPSVQVGDTTISMIAGDTSSIIEGVEDCGLLVGCASVGAKDNWHRIYDGQKYLGRAHVLWQDHEYLYTVHAPHQGKVFEGSSPNMRGALDTSKSVLKNVRVGADLLVGKGNSRADQKYMVVVQHGPLGGSYTEYKSSRREADHYARSAASGGHGFIASVLGPESEFPLSAWKNRDGRVQKMSVAGESVGAENAPPRGVGDAEYYAWKLADHLNALEATYGFPRNAKGKEDRSLVKKFQVLEGIPADGAVGPTVLLRMAKYNIGPLPHVWYWPKNATSKNVEAYRAALHTIANNPPVSSFGFQSNEVHKAAKRENGEGGVTGRVPADPYRAPPSPPVFAPARAASLVSGDILIGAQHTAQSLGFDAEEMELYRHTVKSLKDNGHSKDHAHNRAVQRIHAIREHNAHHARTHAHVGVSIDDVLGVSGSDLELARRAPRKPGETLAALLRRKSGQHSNHEVLKALGAAKLQAELNKYRSVAVGARAAFTLVPAGGNKFRVRCEHSGNQTIPLTRPAADRIMRAVQNNRPIAQRLIA